MSLLSRATETTRQAAQLCSSLVRELRSRLPTGLGGASPFFGRYEAFAAVPVHGQGYDQQVWIDACLAEAGRLRDTTDLDFWQRKSRELEPLVVALLARSGPIAIVDFGGAVGFSYLLLKRRLGNQVRFDYHVVEQPAVCEAGRRFFQAAADIHFHDQLDFLSTLPTGGLLNIASSLQYVDDWRGKLRGLTNWKPEIVLMTQLTAGDQPTFASAQRNLPGAILPHWFLNQAEVIEVMQQLGYECLYHSRCESPVQQPDYPQDLRIGQYRNLLFARRRE